MAGVAWAAGTYSSPPFKPEEIVAAQAFLGTFGMSAGSAVDVLRADDAHVNALLRFIVGLLGGCAGYALAQQVNSSPALAPPGDGRLFLPRRLMLAAGLLGLHPPSVLSCLQFPGGRRI